MKITNFLRSTALVSPVMMFALTPGLGLADTEGDNITKGDSIQEVQEYATQWLWTYNNDRPNMGIGGVTPAMKLNQYKMAA